jgi:hypothetical protein
MQERRQAQRGAVFALNDAPGELDWFSGVRDRFSGAYRTPSVTTDSQSYSSPYSQDSVKITPADPSRPSPGLIISH